MDGSNSAIIVSGIRLGFDIEIDFQTSRIYWSDGEAHTIDSSNWDGGDRESIVQSDGVPYGVAVGGGRIYWGEFWGDKLMSSTITGDDIVALQNGSSHGITDIEIVSRHGFPHNRTNHCAGHSCPKLCVLTMNSSRCIS